MSDLHRTVFEIRLQWQDGQPLSPQQRQLLEGHMSECPACRMDARLSQSLRQDAVQRWPLTLTPQPSSERWVGVIQSRVQGVCLRRGIGNLAQTGLLAVFTVGLVITLAWIINNLRPQPLPAQPDVGPAQTLFAPFAPDPSATPAFQESEIEKTAIPPLLEAEEIFTGEWSPNSKYFFFATSETIDNDGLIREYTTLNFFDRQRGEICQFPQKFLGSLYSRVDSEWLPDGRLFVTPGTGDVLLLTPCQDETQDLSPLFDETVALGSRSDSGFGQLVLSGESAFWLYDHHSGEVKRFADIGSESFGGVPVAWSPCGGRLAIYQPGLVSIFDVQTVSLQQVIEGKFGAIDWIGETRLFSHNRNDEGLLAIDLSMDPPVVTPVVQEVFGIQMEPSEMIWGSGSFFDAIHGRYHLTLTIHSPENPLVYLYHSESDEVEMIPLNADLYLFFPDGEWSWMEAPNIPDTGPKEIELRWVDEPQRPPQRLTVLGHADRVHPTLWGQPIPSKERLAFGSTQGVSIISTTDGEQLGFWRLEGGGYEGYPYLRPAPDGQAMMVVDTVQPPEESGRRQALYFIPLGP